MRSAIISFLALTSVLYGGPPQYLQSMFDVKRNSESGLGPRAIRRGLFFCRGCALLLRRGGGLKHRVYDMTTYVATNPVTLGCGQCGARVGEACKMSPGDFAQSHIERVLAAARKEVAARKKLGKAEGRT